jgi:hypothetical protein
MFKDRATNSSIADALKETRMENAQQRLKANSERVLAPLKERSRAEVA